MIRSLGQEESMRVAIAARESEEHPFDEADRVMKGIKTDLVCHEALSAEHGDVERLIRDKVMKLQRALFQAHLDLRAAKQREVEVEGADGIARTQVRESERKLETLFGEVTAKRHLYQAPGTEGLAPMDAALNLSSERYSHGVRRFVAEACARSSFDEVVEQLGKQTGAHVPKRQVEELAVRAAQDFDAFYAERACEAEATSALLILSFDGKGIAMRPDPPRALRSSSSSECYDSRLVRSKGAAPKVF